MSRREEILPRIRSAPHCGPAACVAATTADFDSLSPDQFALVHAGIASRNEAISKPEAGRGLIELGLQKSGGAR